MKGKKGISLIVLVITIIVIIVLAVAVILSIANNNPIGNAKEARFKSDVRTMQEELEMLKASNYANNNGTSYKNKNGNDIVISDLKSAKNYNNKFSVSNGVLKYKLSELSNDEREWAKELNLSQYVYVLKNGENGVTIENGVCTISDPDALYAAVGTDIEVPEGVVSLSNYGNKLTSIVLPSTFYSAFTDCTSLISVKFSKAPTSCNLFEAFMNCTSLESVEFPEDMVECIGYSSFYNCKSLKSITIPKSTTVIPPNAFYGCCSLKSITIPANTTDIYENVFANCTSLENMVIEGTPRFVASEIEHSWGVDISKVSISGTGLKNGGYTLKNGRSGITISSTGELTTNWNGTVPPEVGTDIEIPEGVKKTGTGAFLNCTSLKNVKIPNSLTTLDMGTFNGCTSLTNIIIPANVTTIDIEAFMNCTSLKKVEILGADTTLGHQAFMGCTALESINIPENLSTIIPSTFENCISLKSIVIPKATTQIYENAFKGCTSLTNVTIEGDARFTSSDIASWGIDTSKATISGSGYKTN